MSESPAAGAGRAQRPMSPHLQIYRPQITSVLSILHRISGFAMVVGTIALVAWLWGAAYSPALFAAMHTFFVHPLGRILMLGWTFSYYFHLANGIRHLFWDIGRGFDLDNVNRSGFAVVVFSILATAATWLFVVCELRI